MDETAIRGKGMELNGRGLASRRIRCSSIRIRVEGYDTGLPVNDVESALRKHFATCGEITHVDIPILGKDVLNRHAFLYLLGEGAEDKALELSGTDVGGWTVLAESLPYQSVLGRPGKKLGPKHRISVSGYDTWLPLAQVTRAIREHFSSCGDVVSVIIPHDPSGDRLMSRAMVSICGEGASEKAQKLSECKVGGMNLAVDRVFPIMTKGLSCGYIRPDKKLKTTRG